MSDVLVGAQEVGETSDFGFTPLDIPRPLGKGSSGLVYSAERPQGNYSVPPELYWAGYYADKVLTKEPMEHPDLYHGTRLSVLGKILGTGKMLAFAEEGPMAIPLKNPAIFGTTNPAMAVNHSAENGPHDTWENRFIDKEDPVVLLRFDYVSGYKDNSRLLDRVSNSAKDDFVLQQEGVPLMDIGVIMGQEFPLKDIEVIEPGERRGEVKSTSFVEYCAKRGVIPNS